LPALPDDYDYAINEDGEFVITTSNGDEIVAPDRAAAMEAINDAYRNNEGLPGEPSEDEIEEKAQELVREEAPEIAREYANDSEYANRSFEVAFRPPTYKIVKEEGSRGIVDLFTGRETPEHYRVIKLEFDGLPDDDDVVDTDGGSQRERKNMPDDADEFWEMFGDDAKEEPVDQEFATEEEARAWAESNVGRGEPKWILWDSDSIGRRGDPERDNIGEYDDWSEAERAANSERESRYESEVEQFVDSIEEYVDMDRYRERAREQLERDDEPSDWFTSGDVRGRLLPGWTRHGYRDHEQVDAETERLRLQHPNSYQSDGGENYREIVIGVPDIEAYNTSDTTHFGHVFQGRTVAWARVKERTSATAKRCSSSKRSNHSAPRPGASRGSKAVKFKTATRSSCRTASTFSSALWRRPKPSGSTWLRACGRQTGRALYAPDDIRFSRAWFRVRCRPRPSSPIRNRGPRSR
jgi:hypothetical protein